ncbi:MAG: hypothetical protein Kow0031_28920 [Anaerolineae bacterium]
MNRALVQASQVKVTLSLQVELNSRDGAQLVALALGPLVWLAMLLWRLRLWVNRLRYEWAMFRQDLAEAAAFTLTLFAIAFNAWAWALGVRR